jgi:hypothetical protein
VTDEKDDSQAARVERARRLREEIANLQSGDPQPKPPGQKKSIREQVEEASRKRKRKTSPPAGGKNDAG